MHLLKRTAGAFAVVVAVAVLGPLTPLAAQQTRPLALSAFGGFTNDPTGFDVFRQSDFDQAYHFGGSLAFRLSANVGVRGDFALAKSSGHESGALDEDVQFDRTYYGAAIEARFPMGALTPYLLAGGGMVTVDRSAPNLTYAFSEMAGRLGGGVSLPLGGASWALFAEVSEWIYARATTGEGLQMDMNVSIGVSFVPEL